MPIQHSRGAVASGHKITTEAASEILRDGGNAFDAVIAGLWAACVAEPVLCSPAGGGFLMAQPANQPASTAPLVFDFFVAAPLKKQENADFRAITVDFGAAHQDFHIGPGSSATPGFVPGLYAVHEALGRLPMYRILQPAINVAQSGHKISAFQAHVGNLVTPIVTTDARNLSHLASGGLFSGEGNIAHNTALAETFVQLAEEGVPLFTHGDMAHAMAETCSQERGHLTTSDFAAYKVKVRKPIKMAHQGWQLFLNPPPAAGGGLIGLTLQTAFELTNSDQHGLEDYPLTLAKSLLEAAEKRYLGPETIAQSLDPNFISASDKNVKIRKNAQRGTTHISVIDGEGNAAAATVSNGEGNGQMVGGFFMNNVLGEDDVNPEGLGNWTPGARLSSMMAPSILRKAGHIVALGSGGSNRIRSAIAQVISHLTQGANLIDAVSAPRLHVEADHLDFEPGFTDAQKAALKDYFPDHRAWAEPNMFFGGVHSVAKGPNDHFEAVADDRRDGAAQTI